MVKLRVDQLYDDDYELLDQMYKTYLDTPRAVKEMNNLGISDELVKKNITKINDFVEDLRYCSNCPGIQNCKKSNPLYCTQIVYKSGVIDRQIVPCKKYLDHMKFEKNYLIRDFPDEWLYMNITNLEKTSGKQEALQRFMKLTKEEKNEWIYLRGASGVGKSFLAAMLANKLNKDGKGTVIFANWEKRVNDLIDYYYKDKERFKKEIDRYSSVPLLVLDNFGNGVNSDIVRDSILSPIISERANKKLFTIIATPYTLKQIKVLYAGNKVGEIKMDQIIDKIKKNIDKEINIGELSVH